MRFNDFLHLSRWLAGATKAAQQDDLQPNFFWRQFSLISATFLTYFCPGEDGADYEETLILDDGEDGQVEDGEAGQVSGLKLNKDGGKRSLHMSRSSLLLGDPPKV